MLLHEVLARERMRDDQHRARQERLARRLATARRWQRLARYADRAGPPRRRAPVVGSQVEFGVGRSLGTPLRGDCRYGSEESAQLAKPGCQRWAIPRSGTVASSWHSTPNVPVLTRWISR
jgi:hypothetical protein